MVVPIVKTWRIQGHGLLDDLEGVASTFHLRLELEIEYDGLKGIDDYSIDICDKEGLKKEIDRLFESEFEKNNNSESCYLDKTIVLNKFNKEKIKELINEFIKNCFGNNLNEVNLKLKEKLEYNP